MSIDVLHTIVSTQVIRKHLEIMSRAPTQLLRALARTRPTTRDSIYVNAIAGPSRQCRPFVTSTPHLTRTNPKHNAGKPPSPGDQTPRLDRRMTVQLVDPVTGSLHPAQPVHSIKYDKSTHDLRMVSSEPPIVKLINLMEEAEKARESEVKMKMNRKTAFEDKEIQISWNSADGDLKHKLDIARGFLERGDRVHMVFAPKGTGAGVAEVSQARKEEMLGYFENGMDDLGMRWRDELKTKSSVVVYWQASNQLRQEKRIKVNEAELAKKKISNEKKEARRLKEEERKRKAAEKA